jgi:Flp pilus assembly CpaE family ATPase
MRIQSLIALAAASVIMIGLGAIAGIAAYMSRATGPGDVRVAVAAKPLDRGCLDCGVVIAVRQVELKGRKAESASQYQIRVRMSDGSERTVTYTNAPAWKAGDRVRLLNGRLVG